MATRQTGQISPRTAKRNQEWRQREREWTLWPWGDRWTVLDGVTRPGWVTVTNSITTARQRFGLVA